MRAGQWARFSLNNSEFIVIIMCKAEEKKKKNVIRIDICVLQNLCNLCVDIISERICFLLKMNSHLIPRALFSLPFSKKKKI